MKIITTKLVLDRFKFISAQGVEFCSHARDILDRLE